MSHIDTLLFDLDGTLIDSLGDLVTSVNLLRNEFNFPALDRPTIAGFVGDGANLLVQRALPEGFYRDEHLARFLVIYHEHLTEETAPFPGIVPFLEVCHDKALAVVTNKPLGPTLDLLAQLDLEKFFPIVVGGDSLAQKKPDPAPVHHALLQLDRSADTAVMIGDHVNDLLAGQGAGAKTCFCSWGMGQHRGTPYDFEAHHPIDLQRLFLQE